MDGTRAFMTRTHRLESGTLRLLVSIASRVGFEPTTKGLKVPCSATELPARRDRITSVAMADASPI